MRLDCTKSPYNKRIELTARGRHALRLREDRAGSPPGAGLPPRPPGRARRSSACITDETAKRGGLMKFSKVLYLIIFSSAVAISQPPQGTLQVKISPKEVKPGDSVWFEAGLFSASQCPFRSSYKITESESNPESLFVFIKSEPSDGPCALAYGFSGPSLHIVANKPGYYTAKFDSTSTFKPDLKDSAVFIAKNASGIRNNVGRSNKASRTSEWLVNGRPNEQQVRSAIFKK